jgi:hypothetical protein
MTTASDLPSWSSTEATVLPTRHHVRLLLAQRLHLFALATARLRGY